MAQVEFMDGNQIFDIKGVFLNFQHAGPPEIDDAVVFKFLHNFPDTVEFR